MIKSSKSIVALFFLFICFLSSTRYLQKIIFDREIINSIYGIYNSNNQICKPQDNSLINFYQKKNLNPLIIIIDAYPNNEIYKKLTGFNSELHKYLNSISSESKESKTIIATTQLSLPYLLGKIPINQYCRYPFLGGAVKPKLLLNHELIQSNEGVCPNSYEYSSRNAFTRYLNRFRGKFDKKYNKDIKEILNNCSVSNTNTINLILKDLTKTKLIDANNRINIAHEFRFHRNDGDILKSNELHIYDSKYLKGIKYLVDELRKNNAVDEIIVMNDHGPRSNFFGNRSNKFKSESLIDQDFHGIFVYKIPIKQNSKKSLEELIPEAKVRYFQDSSGKISKLENFIYEN